MLPCYVLPAVTLLLAKLLSAPSFVVGISLIGRRFGPAIAGFIAALPLVAGPILALLVAEQGLAFGARAALAGAVGAAPTMVFALAYAHAARHSTWPIALSCSYLAYFASAALFFFLPTTWFTAIAAPLFTWALTLRAFPRTSATTIAVKSSSWDLPIRVVATLTLVLLITSLARVIGPERSGLLTPFPIATAVLAAFTHREGGPQMTAVLLRSLVRGLLSFVAFFIMIGLVLPQAGAVTAFLLGSLASLSVHAGLSLLSAKNSV